MLTDANLLSIPGLQPFSTTNIKHLGIRCSGHQTPSLQLFLSSPPTPSKQSQLWKSLSETRRRRRPRISFHVPHGCRSFQARIKTFQARQRRANFFPLSLFFLPLSIADGATLSCVNSGRENTGAHSNTPLSLSSCSFIPPPAVSAAARGAVQKEKLFHLGGGKRGDGGIVGRGGDSAVFTADPSGARSSAWWRDGQRAGWI